jgi:hypothetical protein
VGGLPQRVQDTEPKRRFERPPQTIGSIADSLVPQLGGDGQVGPDSFDQRRQFHDVSMTSLLTSVKRRG